MKAIDLIKSFLETAKWSTYKDALGRPIRGSKWITQKQGRFLNDLINKEDSMQHMTGSLFIVNDYNVWVGKLAPNGCRCLKIELRNEVKREDY